MTTGWPLASIDPTIGVMGYTTDFIGHIDIRPVLNEAEREYLEAFRRSRRFDRAGGPYEVPGNPYAETSDGIAWEKYNNPAPGQPQLWCQRTVCSEGCCLSWDGQEKFYEPVEWLRYLNAHFLRARAKASRSGDLQFDGFSFDHVLDGMVVGCRRDTRELFAITATRGRITTTVLHAGKPEYAAYVPLAYQVANDRTRTSTRSRGERRRALGVVPGQ